MANARHSGSARRRPHEPDRRRSGGTAASRRRQDAPAQQTPRRKPAGSAVRRSSGTDNMPQRRRRGSILLRLVTMLVVVAVFVFGLAIFFKVTEIQVTGNNVYTAQEVVDASGIQMGDNLVTISKGSVVGKILAQLPFVEEISMERVLPGTVVIHVTESDVIYTVDGDDGAQWLMNGSGKILAKADAAADYPHLSGVTAEAPEIGSQITSTEQSENLTAALELLPLLEETEYISQVTEIQVDKTYDIVVLYGDTYEIHLGGTEQLEYKMQYLAAILDEPQVAEGGIIDLSLEESSVAVFKPWSAQSTANSSDTSTEADGTETGEDATAETDPEGETASAENSDENS